MIYSHEYVGLAGELEAQNVAVLRLCLAALHTIFHRYNVNGEREGGTIKKWHMKDGRFVEGRLFPGSNYTTVFRTA